MHMIINNSSMVPIYEQIVDQIKASIVARELLPGDPLPSVRALAREQKISALTVKKAYDYLEEEGFTVTIHGKGTFVAETSQDFLKEEQKKDIEEEFEQLIDKARRCGLSDMEITDLFNMLLEE
ncbi:GntR family transcriptional regulator [Roseburia sp. MUC/MUC-530-WT-4D]|uniref:GntR family transcriptional regulator n=1 Tax=Roseburia porci TaxID=2605790 RepID=A0A6L5YN72_9FIRM|nr:GntR family transcriptional regulator [Roseburia porci]MCI5517393.1 GntR family transcriptional regulator [Roseburia sp.]MDD6742855.1 GntR family transcriptional regulator [Roseburia porci]MST73933.1 GntR family transcriptional regulator [Roseburia porci]